MATNETVQQGMEMLRERYEERDHFLSDSDILDVADVLAPVPWDSFVATAAHPEGEWTSIEAELAELVHADLVEELYAQCSTSEADDEEVSD